MTAASTARRRRRADHVPLAALRRADEPETPFGTRRERAGTGVVVPLALAIPVATIPLQQAFQSHGWWWMLLGSSVVIIAAGWCARAFLAAWAGPVATALAAIACVWMQLGYVFRGDVLPGSSFLEQFFGGLADGALQVWSGRAPLDVTPQLSLLLLSAGVLLVVLADVVAIGVHAPIIVGVAIVIGAAAPPSGALPDVLQMLPALVVAIALALSGPARRRTRVEPSALGASALAAVLALIVPTVVPEPQAVQNYVITFGDSQAEGQSEGLAATPSLDAGIDVFRELTRSSPVALFDYRTNTSTGIRLRLRSLDELGPNGFMTVASADAVDPAGPIAPSDTGTPSSVAITTLGFTSDQLPAPASPTSFSGDVEGAEWSPTSTALELPSSGLVEGSYEAQFVQVPTDPATISAQVGTSREPDELMLPELASLAMLAGDVIPEGANDYDAALALQQVFLDGSWTYDEQPDFTASTPGLAWIDQFMEDRAGYCVHYATAMAALAHVAGLQSRVTIGFLAGTPLADGSYRVTTNDMHAWAEIWFDGVGWVPFETTPGGADESTSSPGSDPDGATADDDPVVPAETEPVASSAPPVVDPAELPSASPAPTQQEPDDATTPIRVDPALVAGVAATLAGLLLNLLPAIARAGQRVARRRRGASGAWQEIVATAIDVGVGPPVSWTMRDLEAAIAPILGDPRASAALGRIRSAAEHARYDTGTRRSRRGGAPGPEADDLRIVRRALMAPLSPLQRAVAVLAPRSLSGLMRDRQVPRRSTPSPTRGA